MEEQVREEGAVTEEQEPVEAAAAPVEAIPAEEAPAEPAEAVLTEEEAPMSEEEPPETETARPNLIGRNLAIKGEKFVILRFRLRSEPARENAGEEAVEITEEPAPDIGDVDLLGLKGRIGELEYTATSIEGAPVKRAFVYLPEGYSPDKKYPVLYLLHGVGGGESEWLPGGNGKGNCLKLLESLRTENKLKDFLIVFPNGRTCPDFQNIHNRFVGGKLERTPNVAGFFEFEKELRNDLIPAVEQAYSVSADRSDRALAGLSMGGMQTINIGVCHCLDLFGWFGAFSMGTDTVSGEEAGNAIAGSPYRVNGVYLCCGTADELCYPVYRAFTGEFSVAAGDALRTYKTELLPGLGHTFEVWDHAFAEFVQFAFAK